MRPGLAQSAQPGGPRLPIIAQGLGLLRVELIVPTNEVQECSISSNLRYKPGHSAWINDSTIVLLQVLPTPKLKKGKGFAIKGTQFIDNCFKQ